VPPRARRAIGPLVIALALLLFGAGTFAAGYATARLDLPGAPAASGSSPPRASGLGVVGEAWRIVEGEFYDRRRVDPARMSLGAIKGMLEALEDPYTLVADQERTRRQGEEIRGAFDGIGISVEVRDGRLLVSRVVDGSPAATAGLRVGDAIARIDEDDVVNPELAAIVERLRGPRGTRVALTVRREGTASPLRLDVVRGEIRTAPIVVRTLPNGVVYLRISSFNTTTGRELREQIDRLGPEKPSGVVVDLRNNPGGVLQSAVDVVSQFLEDGVVAYEQRRDGEPTPFYVRRAGGGSAIDLPMAVLVNRGSASAAEIVAGALQDRQRAVLVGEATYGKDSVQNVHRLSDQSSIRVTTARWFTPLRQAIAGRGLQPDLAVAMSEADRRAGRDPQLESAADYLRTRLARAP
jgi:carboxyl-terminal processing protease